MEKIKTILNANRTYVLLFVVLAIYMIFKLSIPTVSRYDGSEKEFFGHITKRVLKDDKVSFILSGKEEIICNYYSDEEEEREKMWREVPVGSTVRVTGTLKSPNKNTIPNSFNYREYLHNKGIFYTCTIEDIEVSKKSGNPIYMLKNAVENRVMTFGIRDYLYTMIIGEKSLLDDETMSEYRKNGVTHLFAISGMHIGLFATIIAGFLKKLKIREKKVPMYVAAFLWFYAFLAGFGASVVRAVLLFSYIAIDKLFDMRISKIKILLLVGMTILFMEYRTIFDIGFIYSFVTTFGLIWASRAISKHKILGVSVVAFLYSLPITVNNFYTFNLASIFFNIIFVPLVSIIVYPLCLATFFLRFLEPVTAFAIGGLEFLNTVCAEFDGLVFVVPHLPIVVSIVYYVILLKLGKKNLYRTAIILIVIVLVNKIQPLLDKNAYVEFMDVGQGDSAIIRTPHNREVTMIDTGGKIKESQSKYNVSDGVITYLNSLGIDHIDYLVLSHGDADHLGDAMNVIKKMKVKKVILNLGEYNKKEEEILAAGCDVVSEYRGELKVRSLNDKEWGEENADSLVWQFELEDVEFLFMGDAPKEVEDYIMKKKNVKADVIKLGHHGSKTSSGEEFLKKINAHIGIISSGRNNRYNHPSKETIETLRELSLTYYDTQEVGTISLKLKSGRVTPSLYPP